jgi:hypothetical protein
MAGEWRCQAAAAHLEWATKAPSSSIAGCAETDYNKRLVLPCGGETAGRLTLHDYSQLQDLWATIDPVYDNLRDMYRTV